MAKTGELQLVVHSGPRYERGDILNAFTSKCIAIKNAEMLCREGAGFNSHNRRDRGTLLEVFLKNVYEYRFERVSPKEVKRIKLSDMSEDIFSGIVSSDHQQMDVISYVRRRTRKNKRHLIFGSAGREVWYGGNEIYTDAEVNTIWAEIEDRTAHRRENYRDHPMGTDDAKSFLSITVDDMDDATVDDLMFEEWDRSDKKNPILIRKRKHRVEFDKDLPLSSVTKGRIDDNNEPVDVRGQDKINIRADIVKAKN